MTWQEFKQQVEALGVTDTDVVAYIDWTDPSPVVLFRFDTGPRGEQVGLDAGWSMDRLEKISDLMRTGAT